MRYVSIDIETTGLDPATDQILEFAAVADDGDGPLEELYAFQRVVKHERLAGNAFAINMNAAIISDMVKGGPNVCTLDELVPMFLDWLGLVGYTPGEKLIFAGKNVMGFDLQFLKLVPGWKENVRYFHRTLDPGPLWVQPTDLYPPDLRTCLLRSGLDEVVTHRALGDARAVVHCLRKGWDRCSY